MGKSRFLAALSLILVSCCMGQIASAYVGSEARGCTYLLDRYNSRQYDFTALDEQIQNILKSNRSRNDKIEFVVDLLSSSDDPSIAAIDAGKLSQVADKIVEIGVGVDIQTVASEYRLHR